MIFKIDWIIKFYQMWLLYKRWRIKSRCNYFDSIFWCNVVLKLRSNNNIVTPPANTGNDNNNKIVVNKIDHANKVIFSILNITGRVFKIVVIKLIEPKINEIPLKCYEKIREILIIGRLIIYRSVYLIILIFKLFFSAL